MFHHLHFFNLRAFLIERLNLLEQQNWLLTAQCIFDFLGKETPQSRSVKQRSLCNEGYTSRIPLFKSKYKTTNLESIKIFLQNIRQIPSTLKSLGKTVEELNPDSVLFTKRKIKSTWIPEWWNNDLYSTRKKGFKYYDRKNSFYIIFSKDRVYYCL